MIVLVTIGLVLIALLLGTAVLTHHRRDQAQREQDEQDARSRVIPISARPEGYQKRSISGPISSATPSPRSSDRSSDPIYADQNRNDDDALLMTAVLHGLDSPSAPTPEPVHHHQESPSPFHSHDPSPSYDHSSSSHSHDSGSHSHDSGSSYDSGGSYDGGGGSHGGSHD